jgi:hypothetical protein
MTSVAIHQPQYLPWLPLVDKADQVDVFVYLDIVQYQRRGVQNRNQVRNAQGPLWLTVPVTAGYTDRILDVRIAGQEWRNRHLATLQHAYARAPHRALLAGFRELLESEWERLVDLNVATTEWLFQALGVRARRVRASELAGIQGSRDELILSILGAVGATRYVSGRGARVYQDPARFASAGVDLVYQTYEPVPYPQCQPGPFARDLSAVDALFNLGPAARNTMLAGRRPCLSAEELHRTVDPRATLAEDEPDMVDHER